VAGSERLICAAAELADRGKAVRFEVEHCGETAAAFVIRFGGAVYGYLNRCGHRSIELDWREGEVFDSEGRNLICSMHGASYAPASGRCLGGPCAGTPLRRLRIEERGGYVYYMEPEDD